MEHLFVVRLWSEAAPDRATGWRGSIEHIASSQRLYFSTLADLNDFITLRIGSAQIASSGKSGQ